MRVVSGGTAAWNAIAYGQQNPLNLGYFKNQLENIGQNLNEQAKIFYQDVQSLYDKFNSSEAMRLMRSAMKSAASLFNDNIIRPLTSTDELQNASIQMQRWVMANPVIRQMYHNQECDGYSDTYVDMEPGKIGEAHYDYRRVMDGIVVCDEDQESFTQYFEDLHEGDRDLILSEQSDILTTWSFMEAMVKALKDDPTSQYGGQL
jgi:hypothetical protein